MKLNKELIAFIRELKQKGIKIGIASQQEYRRKQYLLAQPELNNLFDVHFFSCDIAYLKTQSAFYQYIVENHTEKIYFWDDTIENVQIAHQSGIHSYLYTDLDRFKIELNNILQIT